MQHANRSAAVLALLSVAAVPAAAAADGLEFAAEVDSCLAAVNHRVDMRDANRVRHLVTGSKRTGMGYALTIETSVFSGGSEKRYAVHCLARGRSEPIRLRIDDLET